VAAEHTLPTFRVSSPSRRAGVHQLGCQSWPDDVSALYAGRVDAHSSHRRRHRSGRDPEV